MALRGLATALEINHRLSKRVQRTQHSGQRKLEASLTYAPYENCVPVPYTSSILVFVLSSILCVPFGLRIAPLWKDSRRRLAEVGEPLLAVVLQLSSGLLLSSIRYGPYAGGFIRI
jgi:hypothetical protein